MNVKLLCVNALIASLYIGLVYAFFFLSFNAIQFRVAEVLLVLLLFNKKYIYGIVLGTILSNLFGPLGYIDALIGGLATLLGSLLIIYIKNKYISLLFPSILNSLFVGIELYYIFDFKEIPFILNVIYIFIGEFVVSYVLVILVDKFIRKNQVLVEYLTL